MAESKVSSKDTPMQEPLVVCFDLRNIIRKVAFVTDVLLDYGIEGGCKDFLRRNTRAIAEILGGVEGDLKTINDALYPKKESPETAT